MMKAICKYILVDILMTMAISCDDFLETTSQDLIVPKTVEHYKELLQGEGYFKEFLAKSVFALYMTDDVEYFDAVAGGSWGGFGDSNFESYGDSYKWETEIENDVMTDRCYQYLYKQILVANTCISALDEMEGTDAEKKILSGQAHFTRAFGYFLLANFYAQAYNEAQATDPCVPLVLDPTPTMEKFPRATMEEVWGRIKSDVEEAISSLEKANISGIYEINYGAALILGVRVALFMEDFDLVIEYGEKVLKINSSLYDITDKPVSTGTSSPSSSNFQDKFIYPANNPEIMWLYDNGEKESHYDVFYVGGILAGDCISISSAASNSIVSMFDYQIVETEGGNVIEGDKRFTYWIIAPSASYYPYVPIKYDHYNIVGEDYQSSFRTGEVYISLAEAYARKTNPEIDKVLEYLNALRSHRIKPYTSLNSGDFASVDALIKFVWDERRRELCFEEHHRWWDLRRTGQPALSHTWMGGEVYKLKEKDPAYVINFPQLEREFNSALNNARPIRLPE